MRWVSWLLLFSFSAHANFQMDFLKSKNSAKSSTRWTLADWLAQKNKARLADQWLAMNRAAGQLVEVNLGGGYKSYQVKTEGATAAVDGHSQSYELDAYVSFFNLMGEYEKTDDDQEILAGAVGLRLLGASSQTTNLVARYGLRRLKDTRTDEQWTNAFAEGQLQLYVVDFFGLLGKYRYYLPDDSNQGNRLVGHRVTAGAFVEFGFLRLFANYFQEPIEQANVGQTTTGFEYGAKLFF